ncbi:ribosome biogenesis protein NOP53-like [Oncorhynchus kisutch]|uniref:Ribosome biogenesis protein NOP53 n=1 Tax=Oncorhynchus kisutch TaxID=8019 RepID=A0A8C7HI72_ONCKI|nr:ribosome biogenesis protein NOP53-like [Oncorhynchus kisutch]XP_031652022.1 ribosome biogenesis protein NOP53-like [Oncorhynchus kisutch]XP_031652023.1 ribosome biogenesis protein NOP53-like [Oncorhynchus kisutch]
MAAVKRLKRVAALQPGFISFKWSAESDDLNSGRRKRVNKNKKKNWNKHSDIQDVEEFLDDVRLQERTTGGLISEKPDYSLFFVDIGEQKKSVLPEVQERKKGKKSKSRPLRIDLILQHDSLVPPPKDVLAYQQPNAKKLRRIAENAEKLAAMGVLPRRQKLLLNRRPATKTSKAKTAANNFPDRPYYDLWGGEAKETADPYYLEQTGKSCVKRPEKLNVKPSILPAVEVIAPGGSYNPDFFSHQALLLEAHEVEVMRERAELRIERQLAVKQEDTATEETVFEELVEGLVEEEEEEEEEEEDVSIRGGLQQEKKTEKERKRERADKIKSQQKQAARVFTDKKQQLFQLRSIQATLKRREQRTRERVAQRKANQEAEKSMPRRLGRLKFQAQDLEIQLSDEIPGSLRTLKPEGSVLKDRFKSMQKRNMIEPRERAKFKRRHKVKYVEKRAFREIT